MKESKFIEQNKDKWLGFEKLLNSESHDPDKLSEFFIQITDDLSYARTFYNNRSIRVYLNNICQQLFYLIYKSPKKGGFGFFSRFWRKELPTIAYQARRELLGAFIIFSLAMAIGVISAVHDPDFIRIILGDDYVEMTIANIESGDPMAVYKKAGEFDMFLGITLNNLLVAVKTFLMGILWAAGSVIILLYNGIMVGAFQYFFIEQGLFAESFLTIWLHGTLEISAIVIAGASGLVLGKGIIAPGTYSRLQSFQIAAKRGAKLFLGIVPIIVMAALIESFLTRYTEIPDMVRLFLILVSLAYILIYFVWYPGRVVRKHGIKEEDLGLQASPDFTIRYQGTIKSGADILKDTFLFYRKYSKELLKINFFAALIYLPVIIFIIYPSLPVVSGGYGFWFFELFEELFNYSKYPILLVVNSLFFAGHSLAVLRIFHLDSCKVEESNMRKLYITFVIFAALTNLVVYLAYFANPGLELLLSFFISPIITLSLFVMLKERTFDIFKVTGRARDLLHGNYGFIYGLCFMVFLITIVGYLFFNSPFPLFYMEFVKWNVPMDPETMNFVMVIFSLFFSMFTTLITLPIFLLSIAMCYFSLEEINEANDLKKQLETF